MFLHIARIVNQVCLGMLKPLAPTSPLNIAFRCWPIDLDLYLHMNNASYIRVAEYARWRILPSSQFLNHKELKGLYFIVVDQHVTYMKSIQPFQKYIISMSIQPQNDKYLLYTQKFIQHPADVKPNAQPIEYATVTTKAVLKEPSGKTFRPSEVVKISKWANEAWKRPDESVDKISS